MHFPVNALWLCLNVEALDIWLFRLLYLSAEIKFPPKMTMIIWNRRIRLWKYLLISCSRLLDFAFMIASLKLVGLSLTALSNLELVKWSVTKIWIGKFILKYDLQSSVFLGFSVVDSAWLYNWLSFHICFITFWKQFYQLKWQRYEMEESEFWKTCQHAL